MDPNLKNFRLGALVFCLAILTAIIWNVSAKRAEASVLPLQAAFEREVDKHQIVYTEVSVDPSGKVRLNTKFSNGKKLDGDHFAAVTRFLDKDGVLLFAMVQRKGLNAAFAGGTQEAWLDDSVQLPAEVIERLASVDMQARTVDALPDDLIWKTLLDLGKIIFTGDASFTPSAPSQGPRLPGLNIN